MNSTRHNANNAISLKDKRLNLIRAAQDLGINTESLCGFLKRAIEAEENVIDLTHGLLDEHQHLKRDKSLMEAKLIHFIFEEF